MEHAKSRSNLEIFLKKWENNGNIFKEVLSEEKLQSCSTTNLDDFLNYFRDTYFWGNESILQQNLKRKNRLGLSCNISHGVSSSEVIFIRKVWFDMTINVQARTLILSKEVGYLFWVWMNPEKSCEQKFSFRQSFSLAKT